MGFVDVFHGEKLLFSYPVSVGGMNYRATEADAIELGLKAAREDKLVPEDKFKDLRGVYRHQN